MPPTTPRAARPVPQRIVLVMLACTEALALVTITGYGQSPILLAAALHAGLLMLTAAYGSQIRRRGDDVTFVALALISSAILGPLGFLGAAILSWRRTEPQIASPLVTQWYERIALSTSVSREERLCEDVAVGRTIDLGGAPPRSFPAIMSAGSLLEQQAVLGQIARNFDAKYLPTLKVALASPEPVVRVQAAAVASHISPAMGRLVRDRVDAASRAPSDPRSALALLDDIALLLDSGLLDAAESRQLEALGRRLGDTVVTALARGPIVVGDCSDPAVDARILGRLEHLLIERRLFAELRTQRTALHLRQRHPNTRLRRLIVSGNERDASAAEAAP
ncbi:MAG: hypothetical protein AB7L90_22500 [Hyphomicrobiaceae bacterium]